MSIHQEYCIVLAKWTYVPVQDFSVNTDMIELKLLVKLTRQLYAKYQLSAYEINFIELNVNLWNEVQMGVSL